MINKETAQNVCVNTNRLILALEAKVAKNVQSVPWFVNYTWDLETQIWLFEVFSMSGRADDENKEKNVLSNIVVWHEIKCSVTNKNLIYHLKMFMVGNGRY